MSSELWVATTNRDKFREIKELLKPVSIEVHSASEIPNYSAPPETEETFLENARIKARFLKAMKPQSWILSDDSGLEVTSLKNLPGVHSARYAGANARDIENVSKVLKAIQLQTNGLDRSAQFRCVLVLLSPAGEEKVFEGLLKGTISRDMRGRGGFGYDPIFVPEGETKTLAELGLAVKNRLSHRFIAVKLAREFLASSLTK